MSLVLAAATAMLGGCTVSDGGEAGNGVTGGADASPGGGSATCSTADVQLTVFSGCTGAACHDADQPAAGVDLASADPATRLVGVTSSCLDKPLIAAGDPTGSYLLEKLGGAPGCGEPMPYGGTPLSAEEFNCVSDWIQGLSTDTGGGGGGGNGPGPGGGGGGGGGGW